jgi:hypothetical protein
MSDHLLFKGTDGTTDFLLTVWDTDELDLATRPADSAATWSPPVRLQPQPAEIPC